MPSFVGPSGSFSSFGASPVTVVVPASNDTFIMLPHMRVVYFNHATSITTFTIYLPPPINSGDIVSFKFRSAVTTGITVIDHNNNAVFTLSSAITVGQVVTGRYVDPAIRWLAWP